MQLSLVLTVLVLSQAGPVLGLFLGGSARDAVLAIRQFDPGCGSECGDPSSQSLISTIENCPPEWSCVCTALDTLNGTCTACLVAELNFGTVYYACLQADPTTSFYVPPVSGPGLTSTAPVASTTPASVACASTCSSSTDQAAISELNTCAQSEGGSAACLCEAWSTMSSACLECALTTSGYTDSQIQQFCLAASVTIGGGAATLTGNGGGLTPTQSPTQTAAGTSSSPQSPASPGSTSQASTSPSSSASAKSRASASYEVKGVLIAAVLALSSTTVVLLVGMH